MRLTSFSVAIGLLTAAGHAADNPINVPKDGFPVFTAGKPATFTWKPTTDGTVTLRLREGASSDLNGGTLIKANVPNTGSFTYTPPADITRNSDYTIEIIDDSNPSNVNYSPQFVIDSKNTVASMSSASMSASSASAASTSSVSASASSALSASSASSKSTMTKSMSASKSASASASASVSKASASASSTESSASTASPTSAPSSGAVGSYNNIKLGGGLLAAVFGIMAAL